MPYRICQWSPEIEEHLAIHGVTAAEFEEVVCRPDYETRARRSGLPAAVGWVNGRKLFCVFRPLDETNVEPVTAFELDN